MLTSYVAVVPYHGVELTTEDLLHVTAALQTQITRDVGPLWGVTGVVSAFTSMKCVPPGYAPLAVVPSGTLLAVGEHGFHLTRGGQPVGLVEYVEGWSLLASHELIEIVCDPSGARSVRGLSLRDAQKTILPPDDVRSAKPDQGQVEYLVEACDPCQTSSYQINGVLVSDFVTPQYYAPLQNEGARCSFTGLITESRQLLPGGYISWRTRPGGDIWQAFAEMGQPADLEHLRIESLDGIAPGLARNWVDYYATKSKRPDARDALADAGLLQRANDGLKVAAESAQHYGEQLEADIDEILEALGVLDPAPDRDKFIQLFEHLADPQNADGRRVYSQDPGALLALFDIDLPSKKPLKPYRELTADQFRDAADALKNNDRFGPDLGPVGIRKFIAAHGAHLTS